MTLDDERMDEEDEESLAMPLAHDERMKEKINTLSVHGEEVKDNDTMDDNYEAAAASADDQEADEEEEVDDEGEEEDDEDS